MSFLPRLALPAFLLATALCISAQQDSSSTPVPSFGQNPPAADSNSATGQQQPSNPDSSNAGNTADVVAKADDGSNPLAVREIGGAAFLSRELGPWHVGGLYLRDVSLMQAYVVFSDLPADILTIGHTHLLSTFTSDIVYDRYLGRSRFSLQYQPQVTILDGKVNANFNNQNLQLNVPYRLTPRLTLSLSDQFSSISDRTVDAAQFFSADVLSGTAVQHPYLLGRSNLLFNNAGVGINYELSARTSLEVGQSVNYTQAYDNQRKFSNFSYGTTAGINRKIGTSKQIGLFGSYARSFINQGLGQNDYISMGLSYSQRLSPTLSVSAHLGAATQQYSRRKYWTAIGGLTLVKGFRNSTLGLSATRTEGVGAYVNTGYGYLVGLNYTYFLGRRIFLGAGGGYTHLQSIENTKLLGKYAGAQVGCGLTRSIQWFANYTRAHQSGDDFQVLTGNTDLVTTGFRWYPGGMKERARR